MQEKKKWISSRILFTAISEQLAENRQAAFTVTGMSMWPFLCHGRDQVVVEKTERENLKIGDIVLFRATEEKFILHRITRLEETCFQTTGDGNLFRDGYFPYSRIVARTQKVVRKGKQIDCSSLRWKFLSWVWMLLYPIRKWIFCVWLPVRKIIRR